MIDKNYKYFFIPSIFVTLLILIYGVSLDPVFDQRDGLRPREGISIGHNDEIHMTDIEFYFINTRDTDSIELRYNMEYLESSTPGKVGIYFPYSLEITSDSTGWERVEVDSGTAFIKKYECDEKEYCKFHYNEQPIFTLTPEYSKFDTKNRHIHGIKIGIDNTDPPNADRFFRENNMKDFPLTFSYDNSTNREVTIVIPRISDNINPIPIGEPGIFHNRGIDYSNNRISWTLDKSEHAFFLDYEMPNERENFEASKVLINLSGIVLGMLIGSIGIAITFFKKRNDEEIFYTKEKKCVDELLKGIEKGWISRTKKSLKLISGMNESEFLTFVSNHKDDLVRKLGNQNDQVWYELKNSEEFKNKYESKE